MELKILRKGKVAYMYLVDISHLQTLTVLFRKQNNISRNITSSVSVCSGIFFSNKMGGIASIHGCNWNSNASPRSLCILILWEGFSYPSPWLGLISLLCNGQEAQDPSETSKVTPEVPLSGDKNSSWLQLRRMGRVVGFVWVFQTLLCYLA